MHTMPHGLSRRAIRPARAFLVAISMTPGPFGRGRCLVARDSSHFRGFRLSGGQRARGHGHRPARCRCRAHDWPCATLLTKDHHVALQPAQGSGGGDTGGASATVLSPARRRRPCWRRGAWLGEQLARGPVHCADEASARASASESSLQFVALARWRARVSAGASMMVPPRSSLREFSRNARLQGARAESHAPARCEQRPSSTLAACSGRKRHLECSLGARRVRAPPHRWKRN